ncbi:sulfotransferase family protein [Nocardioides euryhalodurans]|uniref:sulfotransferase family protein n=1 Tax=Nocardioides euryhalodurans TaxID=2518370 RepID=UPI00141FE040|nr:sulfotransferase [Nocardioides euryhalodurans]
MTDRLPGFVVAGVPRAGTTTVASHLRTVPGVFVPDLEEVHYFTRRHDRGPDWYAGLYRDARPEQVCVDVTPSYVLHEEAVERIARELPDAVVGLVLRDPVDRAYSHYWLNRDKGTERLGFEEALEAEPERLARDPRDLPHGYLTSGGYARLLRRLHEHVPPDRVHVVLFDDLARDPGPVVAGLCARLGVPPPTEPVPARRTNHHGPARSPLLGSVARRLPGPVSRTVRRWNSTPGAYPPMEPATRERLRDHFAADRDELEELLGRAVPWGRAATGRDSGTK